MLALGELYSNWHDDNEAPVPGTKYFLQAVSLLEDRYEDPTVEHVQALNLISFYSGALGRSQSAYVYAGVALRVAIGLGLHQRQKVPPNTTATQREDHRRVWWTAYIFDRILSSHLGQPVAVRDADIDIELPSMNDLNDLEREEFADPAHLVANIQLARITASMMATIYCPPGREKASFLQRVHTVLASLRQWDESLPPALRRWDSSSPRNVFSLHLLYNQCIIKTTRPVLLHIFQQRFHRPAVDDGLAPHSNASNTTARALSQACVQAACTSNSILSRLFVEGNLATFGFFDAVYLFSSTLVLIISAVLEPDVSVSDAVQTAFQLLKSMAETGNLPARGYYDRLCVVRNAIEGSRSRSNESAEHTETQMGWSRGTQSGAQAVTASASTTQGIGPDVRAFGFDQQTPGTLWLDALDNPSIEQFLAGGADQWDRLLEAPGFGDTTGGISNDFFGQFD